MTFISQRPFQEKIPFLCREFFMTYLVIDHIFFQILPVFAVFNVIYVVYVPFFAKILYFF